MHQDRTDDRSDLHDRSRSASALKKLLVFPDGIEMLHELNRRTDARGTLGYELIDGDFIRRQPRSIQQTRIKTRICELLDAAVPTGSPCETFVGGPIVVVDTANGLIPNVLMQCEPIEDYDSVELNEPVIVVEILSHLVRRDTMDKKQHAYTTLPTLHHYLEVDVESRRVHHYRRTNSRWALRTLDSGVIELDPPGIAITLDELFADRAGRPATDKP